jgi:hypothetical protein
MVLQSAQYYFVQLISFCEVIGEFKPTKADNVTIHHPCITYLEVYIIKGPE